MHIKSLKIENFRAISFLEFDQLTDAIVVAGTNGCGKSSIFDAIRLLKSAYGGYNPNEFRLFFQEFQIDIRNLASEARRILLDPSQPLYISAEFTMAENEKEYLVHNAKRLYLKYLWEKEGQRFADDEVIIVDPLVKQSKGPKVEREANKLYDELIAELDKETYSAELTMEPNDDPSIAPSSAIQLVFSQYRPGELGIVDFHSPDRSYAREQIGGIQLRIEDPFQSISQHALYNTQNKYRNIKSEMAQVYVQSIIAKEAGHDQHSYSSINDTLNELFEIFFPGKRFLGPVPDKNGGISFPVELKNGRRHDLNELSSGEKEVLLGYLRLRNSAPNNSILLLDEPELHLNPRLIRGLPSFYYKHLGQELHNQIWLVTHSDALLRSAIETPSYMVFHMQPFTSVENSENQLSLVTPSANVERAIIDLVGDLATYSPRSKVVILEGGGDSEFDNRFISELFPDFSTLVNLISGGNKYRVQNLQSLLEKASSEGKLNARFFSIADSDFSGNADQDNVRQHYWDRYHIENYLLDTEFISKTLNTLELGDVVYSLDEIDTMLKQCAEDTIDNLIAIKMRNWVNSVMIHSISTGYDPNTGPVQGFVEATRRSLSNLKYRIDNELTPDNINHKYDSFKDELHHSLEKGVWRHDFRGRNILKLFVSKHANGISYESFRNIIINNMKLEGYRPIGMENIFTSILNS